MVVDIYFDVYLDRKGGVELVVFQSRFAMTEDGGPAAARLFQFRRIASVFCHHHAPAGHTLRVKCAHAIRLVPVHPK